MLIRVDSGLIPAIFGALFAFGFGFNLLVAWLQHKGYDEGYMALLVLAGVLVTIMGIALLSFELAVLVLGAFAASGFWMILGSIVRHMRRREKSQKAVIDEAARLAE